MLIAALFVLYYMTPLQGVEAYSCPDNWIRHGSSCYLFIGTKETWMEAGQMCAIRGATLTAVESAEENAFLRGYLKTFGDLGADMTAWLGGNDMEIEGTWKWSPSGEGVTFDGWGGPDPNGDGDCMLFWAPFDYLWGDYACHGQWSFICEKTIATDPVIG